MNCEDQTFFESGVNTGYTDAWKAAGCTVSVYEKDKIEGNGALRISAFLPLFTLSPNISDWNDLKLETFDNVDADWSDYGTLRLQVKNRGKTDVLLREVRLYTSELGYVTPVCNESGLKGSTIPADGEWHVVTFNLNQLYNMGAAGAEKTNDDLTGIKRVQFKWKGVNAKLLLDDIRVLPEESEPIAPTNVFDSIIAYVKALFDSLANGLLGLFGRSAVC